MKRGAGKKKCGCLMEKREKKIWETQGRDQQEKDMELDQKMGEWVRKVGWIREERTWRHKEKNPYENGHLDW